MKAFQNKLSKKPIHHFFKKEDSLINKKIRTGWSHVVWTLNAAFKQEHLIISFSRKDYKDRLMLEQFNEIPIYCKGFLIKSIGCWYP